MQEGFEKEDLQKNAATSIRFQHTQGLCINTTTTKVLRTNAKVTYTTSRLKKSAPSSIWEPKSMKKADQTKTSRVDCQSQKEHMQVSILPESHRCTANIPSWKSSRAVSLWLHCMALRCRG